ncbi:hypothetical protein ElyMa_003273200 [Elysia marginata]|uniref:Uncharacterized protein n=1 Tax=Elysia marginata TaxID=1093978 RepID=A0AAV4J933_9GAST|nr:hypothetical protein ElyMa_003273200 [Elysia marginata]
MRCVCDTDRDAVSNRSDPVYKSSPSGRVLGDDCGSTVSEELQKRLLKFHETRVTNSPCQSTFRQHLDLELQHQARSCPPLEDALCKPLKEVGDLHSMDTGSVTPSDVSADDHSAWLDRIRAKRRQLEAYLHHGICQVSRTVTSGQTAEARLRDSYLGPQTNGPVWLIHILENGVSLTMKPTVWVGYGGTETTRSPTRVVRLGLSSASQKSRYRKLGYSPLTLSEPAIFVCEEIADTLECPSHCASEKILCKQPDTETRYGSGDVEPIMLQPNQPCSDARNSSCCSRQADQRLLQPYRVCLDPPTSTYSGAPHDLHSQHKQSQRLDLSLDLHPDIPGNRHKPNRSLVTYSAVVTECRQLRVVISGSFETVGRGCLPFQLVMFPCHVGSSRSLGVKGTYMRKACDTAQRVRWRFGCKL